MLKHSQEILRNMVYSPRVSTERWITKTKAEVTYPFGGKSKEDVPSLHTEKQNDFQICTKSLSALNKCLQSSQHCRWSKACTPRRAQALHRDPDPTRAYQTRKWRQILP